MINQDNILLGFVKAAQTSVGDLLSTSGPKTAPEPSVIKARQKGKTPGYPYIMVDLLSTNPVANGSISKGLTKDGIPFFDKQYTCLLSYTVYGGNATNIARILCSYLEIPRIYDALEADTGGSLGEVFQVLSIPIELSTEPCEVASFQVSLNINERITDADTGTITRIELNGELLRHKDDPDPFQLTIAEQSTQHP